MQERRVAGRVGRRQLQQAREPGRARAGARNPPPAVGRAARPGRPEAAGEVGAGHAAGQFQQGQRVALGLRDDAAAHLVVERAGQGRVGAARARGRGRSPVTSSTGSPARWALGFAGAEDQSDRVGCEATGGEPERLRRSLVEPLLVVDDADQRAVTGGLGEQREQGQADEEPVEAGGRAGLDASGAQRRPLRRRHLVHPVRDRFDQHVGRAA